MCVGGGEVVVEIVTDPRRDKRIMSQEILKDCVNKEVQPSDSTYVGIRDDYLKSINVA